MRTVTFFGLVTIADAIGAQTGYTMDSVVSFIGAAIFGIAATMDLIEFFKGD